jgi:lysophospholipase L1-like esterase
MPPKITFPLIIIFAFLGRAQFCQADDKAQQPTDVPLPRVIEYPWMNLEQWRAFHQGDLDRAKAGPVDVLFLGDSITECWDTRGLEVWQKQYAPLRAANFGVGGDTTQNVLWRITEGGALNGIHPGVVVLMIGTNNIGLMKDAPTDIAKGVSAVVSSLRELLPEAEILLLSIFPRGETPDNEYRLKVVATNKLIEPLGQHEHVTWLEMWNPFLKGDGTMSKDIMADFLHPTKHGYEIWAKTMKPTLEKLQRKANQG